MLTPTVESLKGPSARLDPRESAAPLLSMSRYVFNIFKILAYILKNIKSVKPHDTKIHLLNIRNA
jgi:hypothetical protein